MKYAKSFAEACRALASQYPSQCVPVYLRFARNVAAGATAGFDSSE
ncbi:MAG: hypothetical protein V2J51_06365 [Erythrobacter sp.]|nr:hypothetical protein [Erythrobacter sp.]